MLIGNLAKKLAIQQVEGNTGVVKFCIGHQLVIQLGTSHFKHRIDTFAVHERLGLSILH